MSFSGLKTALLNLHNRATMRNEPLDIPALAASFQQKVCDILTDKLFAAARDTGAKTLAVAGGVSANALLRSEAAGRAAREGLRLCLPDLRYTGDNAAMIAAQGYHELRAGHTAGLGLNGYATLSIEENYTNS